MYCLVPFLVFSRSVRFCGQLPTYVLLVPYLVFSILFVSVVSYRCMYCLVPFLQFSKSVPVCG